MASRALSQTFSSRTIDAPLAAFAGLAVAFVAGVMPAHLLEELVSLTGLGNFVPQAAPPLGTTARVVVGGFGAVLAFAAVFILLRLVDGGGKKWPPAVREAEEPEAPRLRRRDFHPDAPQPRPLLAPRDLGEPAEKPRPVWLEPEAVAPEPASAAPVPVPAPGPEPELPSSAEPFPVEESLAEPSLRPAAAPEPVQDQVRASASPAPASAGSLDELIARLEQGLVRRRVVPPVESAAPGPFPTQPAPPQRHEGNGEAEDRLQSAIASLQRLAQQHHAG